jgi:hypothetical protein
MSEKEKSCKSLTYRNSSLALQDGLESTPPDYQIRLFRRTYGDSGG